MLQREEVHQAGRCLQGRLLPSGLWSTVPRVQGTRTRPPLPPGQGALHQRQLWVQLDLVEERVGGAPTLLPGFHLGLHPGVEQVASPECLLSLQTSSLRWPLYCKDRLKAVPFRQKNPQVLIRQQLIEFCSEYTYQAQRGQLDFELALRDQAIVGDLHKIPRRTKLALTT